MPRIASRSYLVARARTIRLDEIEARDIVRRVLGIRGERAVNAQQDARRRLEMLAILNLANQTLHRCRAQLGPNASATFNAMTELAVTLASMPGTQRDTGSMQERAGAWLAIFRGARAGQRAA